MYSIPKRLLTDIADVRVPLDTQGYGGYAEAVTLINVRFEQSQETVGGGYAMASPVKGMLYIDAVNTEGAFELPAGTMVRINGETAECCVSRCKACKAYGQIHHWECELV
jgi:hypothetical protein